MIIHSTFSFRFEHNRKSLRRLPSLVYVELKFLLVCFRFTSSCSLSSLLTISIMRFTKRMSYNLLMGLQLPWQVLRGHQKVLIMPQTIAPLESHPQLSILPFIHTHRIHRNLLVWLLYHVSSAYMWIFLNPQCATYLNCYISGDLVIIMVDLTSELCGFAASFLLICGLQQVCISYVTRISPRS